MEEPKKSTKEKILDAAGEVFAQKGYEGATVRDICERAGTNVASVNYYFGGKEGLYQQLCHEMFSTIFNQFPVTKDFPEGTSPEEKLEFFVEGLLNRLLEKAGEDSVPRKSQLLARELAAPTPVMDSLVNEFVRPTTTILSGIIQEVLGPKACEKDISKCLLSMVGQCFYYGLARPIFSRLHLLDLSEPGIVTELARHITCFSLGGMKALRRVLEEGTGPKSCLRDEGMG